MIKIDTTQIPKHKMESMAYYLRETCEKYFDNPENQKKFEEWKKKREKQIN